MYDGGDQKHILPDFQLNNIMQILKQGLSKIIKNSKAMAAYHRSWAKYSR